MDLAFSLLKARVLEVTELKATHSQNPTEIVPNLAFFRSIYSNFSPKINMTEPIMRVFNRSETFEKYEATLKDSIDHFIADFRRGQTDFSYFQMIIFRMIQKMEDPPLEYIWFYSAVTFHSSRLTLQESSKKVLIVKDLLQSIVWFSEPCNGLQKVAVLAPVLYILYSCLKRDLCTRGEIEGLVEVIVSYISICCVNDLEEQDNVLGDYMMVNFLDLIRAWNVDQLGKSCEMDDALRLFFPLLSDEVRQQVNMRCGMRFLAGIVMAEFFLLRLCLRVSRKESQGDMQISMAQTVKGFQNSCFHGENHY